MAEVLLITGLVLGLFYFLFIRPARREQTQRRRHLNALRIGDEVLTRGGLLATVIDVETPADGPMILSLELADGVIVRARTEAIAELLPGDAGAEPVSEQDADADEDEDFEDDDAVAELEDDEEDDRELSA